MIDEVLATVCGNEVPSIVSSYSNEVDVIFQTGSRAYNRQGFRLSFNVSLEGNNQLLDIFFGVNVTI